MAGHPFSEKVQVFISIEPHGSSVSYMYTTCFRLNSNSDPRFEKLKAYKQETFGKKFYLLTMLEFTVT